MELRGESEEEMDEQPPLRPTINPSSSVLDIGSGVVKTVLISFVVTFLTLSLLSFMGGGFLVTQKDFTANMEGIVAAIEQSKIDLANAKAEVTSAVQGIPGTVATYVNNAVSQSTSQWTGQLSSVSDRVTALENSSQINTTSLSQLVSDLESVKVEITSLKESVSLLETQLANYEVRIASLEATRQTGGNSGIELLKIETSEYEEFSTNSANISIIGITVKLTNTSLRDIEDVVLEIPVRLNFSNAALTGISLSGQSGVGNWYIRDTQWRSFTLRNANRVHIDGNDREWVDFNITLTFDGQISNGYFTIDNNDIELIDYDFVGQLGAGSSTVDGTIRQYSIASRAIVYTPLTVTNNGNTAITLPVKLVLTVPSGITVNTAGMSGISSSSISGSRVTFYTTAYVPANSSLTFSQVYVVLNYTGTSSNTWTAVWSKQ